MVPPVVSSIIGVSPSIRVDEHTNSTLWEGHPWPDLDNRQAGRGKGAPPMTMGYSLAE